MEGEGEVAKILIAVVVLVILVGGFILLFKGKGGMLLDSLRDIWRMGR